VTLDAGTDGDEIAVALAVLLHDYDVGPDRQCGTSEDARCTPSSQRCRRVVAGGNAIDTAQGRGAVRIEVVEAHSVAVDRRIVEARHGDGCGDVLGQRAAERAPQGHALDAVDRLYALEDHVARGVDAQKAAAEGKAIVRELRHASLRFSRRRLRRRLSPPRSARRRT
jgi:hypothetical protein